jgi:DnaJ-like protein
MAMSYFTRVVEERIREAQKDGAFDNLPGQGKPLQLEDQSLVPEDLRMAYHILKNAHVLPPEAEVQKEIHTLQDLLKYVEEEGERRALLKEIEWKFIRLDLLRRRSFSWQTSRFYGKKLVQRLLHRS